MWNNYGDKANGELLATYGFAVRDNIVDSVEGIVLGLGVPNSALRENGTARDRHVDGPIQDGACAESKEARALNLHEARMALIGEHSIPHRFEDRGENNGRALFLGPFLLRRKIPGVTMMSESKDDDDVAGAINPDGVIPQDLFRALGLLGMDDPAEGPVISEDEVELLQGVLTRKLEGFGMAATTALAAECASSEGRSCRTECVEAFKDGQRELLRLALDELVSLMPKEEEELEDDPRH